METAWDDHHLLCLQWCYHIQWWNGIQVVEKVSQIKEIIKRNREILDSSLTQEIQTENSLSKRCFKRNIPKLQQELMKKCLEPMKSSFQKYLTLQTLCLQKLSALHNAQCPNEDVDIDSIWEKVMGTDFKGKGKEYPLN